MKARVSISVKILLLSFLNVFLLVLVFAVFVRNQYRLDLGSLLLSPGRDRLLAVSRLIALQLPNTERNDWDRLLAGYTSTTHASACLFNAQGTQLAGPPVTLPQDVLAEVRRERGPHREPPGIGHPPPPRPFPAFLVRTSPPTRYWVGAHVPIFDRSTMRADETTLVWTLPSLWTNSFFFDYTPWLATAILVILVSAACWLPLIRSDAFHFPTYGRYRSDCRRQTRNSAIPPPPRRTRPVE